MKPILEETNSFAGIEYKATWIPAPFFPTTNVTQVSGLCLNQENNYILVSSDGSDWHIPGGHPEENETYLQTLSREIKEETCADLISAIYLGTRKVIDLKNNEIHYQLRYYCIVNSNIFIPNVEISHLKAVKPDQFLSELSYGKTLMAQELFKLSEALRNKK